MVHDRRVGSQECLDPAAWPRDCQLSLLSWIENHCIQDLSRQGVEQDLAPPGLQLDAGQRDHDVPLLLEAYS